MTPAEMKERALWCAERFDRLGEYETSQIVRDLMKEIERLERKNVKLVQAVGEMAAQLKEPAK